MRKLPAALRHARGRASGKPAGKRVTTCRSVTWPELALISAGYSPGDGGGVSRSSSMSWKKRGEAETVKRQEDERDDPAVRQS